MGVILVMKVPTIAGTNIPYDVVSMVSSECQAVDAATC